MGWGVGLLFKMDKSRRERFLKTGGDREQIDRKLRSYFDCSSPSSER
jgi:hypothetical protein